MKHIRDPENEKNIMENVIKTGQEHVFQWWNELNEESRCRLLDQLNAINFDQIRSLKEKISVDKRHNSYDDKLEPVEYIPIPKTRAQMKKNDKARQIGEKIIRSGKVCAFLVAGGQGTRLGFDGPKGCYPIGPVSGKSLFRMHAEKILASEITYGVTIPWYIMTSESNDVATRKFFNEKQYFGLDRRNIFFLKQSMLPALNEHGKFIMDRKDHIFTSPNGHGGSLLALVESGAIEDMKKRGIQVISYFQVDNVLIKIVDPIFIGYHTLAHAEMSSKMVKKTDPMEKVGHFGLINGKLSVIKYSDMTENDVKARNPNGNLKFDSGSIAIHMIDPHFVEKEVMEGLKLPIHVAHKKIPYLSTQGNLIQPSKPNGYKFEMFIFDALKDTTRSIIMEIRREEEFSPIKNKEGECSPESARQDLFDLFGNWIEDAGIKVPRDVNGHVRIALEISPLFAQNREECIERIPSDLSLQKSLYLGPE